MSAADENINIGKTEGFDEPLMDPTDDLLDINEHAEALARYIQQHEKQLPFTVGIFGEWGEGKTTLVRFLYYHLCRPEGSVTPKRINFVSFSAWAFTTSEKLWRALILDIAKVLYGIKKGGFDVDADEENSKPETNVESEPTGWSHTITRFLTGDAFVLNEPAPERDEYEEFVKELDNTDYGKISKRTPSGQVSQEELMSTVVNGALGVLGTMSPLVAGLRGLFGVEPPGAKKAREEAENPGSQIDALSRFQQVFREMLKKRAREEPVYVFIDDLDRAQPDVALDIMESVRIALSEVKCVFIIAVDQRLIDQGLRLRYKELFADQPAGALDSKGQEYLEKIIQFRMRVPPRTAEQAQRLISAEFPQWMPAGDIIQTISGNNPRRIKQYCHRLNFQNMIGLSPFTLGSSYTEEIPAASQHEQTITTTVVSELGPKPGQSEVEYLSFILTEVFNDQEARRLFLILSQNYAEYPGSPEEKVTGLLAKFNGSNSLPMLREGMNRVKPNVFEEYPPN